MNAFLLYLRCLAPRRQRRQGRGPPPGATYPAGKAQCGPPCAPVLYPRRPANKMPGRRRRRLPTAHAAGVRAAWWLGLPFAAVVVAQDECVARDGQQPEDPCEGLAESACTAEACCWGARRHGGEGCRDDTQPAPRISMCDRQVS